MLNNFVNSNIFFTKLSRIDPCEKRMNILGGKHWCNFFLACSKLVTMAIYVRKLDKVSTRIWSEIWHFVGPRRWYWGKKWFWIARGTKNISESHHNTISVRNRDHTRSLSKKSNLVSTNGNGTTKTTAVVVTVVNP